MTASPSADAHISAAALPGTTPYLATPLLQVFLQDYPKWAKTVEQINAAGAMNHGVWKYYKVGASSTRSLAAGMYAMRNSLECNPLALSGVMPDCSRLCAREKHIGPSVCS